MDPAVAAAAAAAAETTLKARVPGRRPRGACWPCWCRGGRWEDSGQRVELVKCSAGLMRAMAALKVRNPRAGILPGVTRE